MFEAESRNNPTISIKKNFSQSEERTDALQVTRDSKLVDMFARTISYLRLSLTDQCNLRCIYCTPKGSEAKLPSNELLTYEELLRICKVAVQLGVGKIRLTGGEPLIRKEVMGFIRQLTSIDGLDDVRITTNGTFLADKAVELYETGIRKINISLDTLDPAKYKELTGADLWEKVWTGIRAVREKGFAPIKLNVVALRGINDEEFIDFARLTLENDLHVRFIEFMPMGKRTIWEKDKYIPAAEILAAIAPLGTLEPIASRKFDAPARLYRIKGAQGSVGVISPISHHFCDKCNRLRLTSEGRLRSCLLNEQETDIKQVIRSGGGEEEIMQTIIATVRNKPKGHTIDHDNLNCHGRMSRIGG